LEVPYHKSFQTRGQRNSRREGTLSTMEKSMADDQWFKMTPETAQAYGRPTPDGFLVRVGSTAMINGSPKIKRDRVLRDQLVAEGILVRSQDPDLYQFAKDHEFTSSSAAGGIIRDGNCSGPSAWKRIEDGLSLREVQSE